MEELSPFRPLIDGHAFDKHQVNQTVALGATEEWRLRTTVEDWHLFHIDVTDFRIVEINGESVDARSLEDTTLVSSFEIVIRARFLDYPGKFVYHCRLDHEDLRMMGVVEVVEAAVITG